MFKLQDSFIETYKGKQPQWGFNGLGYVIYKRSYARDICTSCGGYKIVSTQNKDGSWKKACSDCNNGLQLEEYWQTLKRVIEGTFELQRRHINFLKTRWDSGRAQNSAQEMFNLMWEFKFLPPGRGLFAMGSPLVMEKEIGTPLYNCSFCSSKNINIDFTQPFSFLFMASALGVGVGFDTRGKGKVHIEKPSKSEETLVIADSREGWDEALKRVLNAYVGKTSYPKFDYSLIRPFGAPINTFGGQASGPQSLQELLESDIPEILGRKYGDRINSPQIVDTNNAIGKCVVAGGSRRSSEIALGDADDDEFLSLKSDKEKLDNYRWNSNNSVFIREGHKDFKKFETNFEKYKELGFVFLDNLQKYGRMKDGESDKDTKIEGVNPCSEIGLESGELCNIVETFPAHCNEEEFKRALKYAYLYAKTVTLIKTPWEITNAIMQRNRRIGLSMSGIQQNITKVGFAEHIKMCEDGYNYVQKLDKTYSDWLCIPRSIKTTTIKPSGTVSILAGATPGIHYDHAQYYIRRVRFTKGSHTLTALKKAGYYSEQDISDKYTEVVSFPVQAQDYLKGKNDTTIWEQLENAAQLQYSWADNSISITVDVKPTEMDQISSALDRYQSRLKTVSFLPQEHSYEQAPYEEITKEEYEKMSAGLKKINLSKAEHEIDEKFCDGEVCQL